MTGDAIKRGGRLAVSWIVDGLIGQVTLDGEHWASVEWSVKRQQWCIEDAEGRCLAHRASIHGAAASRDQAVALAEAMIRDGRTPDPATARDRPRPAAASSGRSGFGDRQR